MKPTNICISLTRSCPSNCDFCNFRDFFKKDYPKHQFFPLVMGSLKENTLKEIVNKKWKENEFLKVLFKSSSFGIYEKYLKEKVKLKSYGMCDICFVIRNNLNFIKNFNCRQDYEMDKRIDIGMRKEAIEDAKSLGIKNIIFADEGEPFLKFNEMLELSDLVHKQSQDMIIFTNAYFANDKQSTLQKMKQLKNNGLAKLFLSWDSDPKYKFHQSFIPEKNVILLYKIAKKLKIQTTFISLMTKYTKIIDLQEKLESLTGDKIKLIVEPTNVYGEIKNMILRHLHSEDKSLNARYITTNPRVEKIFDQKDLMYFKPVNNKKLSSIYFRVKDIKYRLFRNCGKVLMLLNNGLVLCCSSNAY